MAERVEAVAAQASGPVAVVFAGNGPTGLRLVVADIGRGQKDETTRPTGHGLRNMQARAQVLGGTVRYEALAARLRRGGAAAVARV